MPIKFVKANGLKFWTEHFGEPTNPPLLLISGGGAQGIMWPEPLCVALAEQGYFVIRIDNRDTGESSTVDYDVAPYTLYDMADDIIGICDAYEFDKVYLVGTSMGGVIAALTTLQHPKRVKSLTLISTSPDIGNFINNIIHPEKKHGNLPKPQKSYLDWLEKRRQCENMPFDEQLQLHLEGWRVMGGTKLTFDEDIYHGILQSALEREISAASINNHIKAIQSTYENGTPPFEKIETTTQILHGTEDPLFDAAHGKAFTSMIPNVNLHIIENMGHNLNSALYSQVIQLICEHCNRNEFDGLR